MTPEGGQADRQMRQAARAVGKGGECARRVFGDGDAHEAVAVRVRLRDEEFWMIAGDARGDFVQPFAEDVERRVGDRQPEREAAASVEHDDGVEIEFREHAAHDVRGVVQRLRRRVAGGFEQDASEGGALEIVGARRPGIEFHRV
jgi:hypothetical protein